MSRIDQHIFLLFALLLFYAIGPIVVLFWGISAIGVGGNIEDDTLVNVLSTFASSPGAYTSVLHQMIVPVAAAVTAAEFRSILSHRLAPWLFILPLATIFVCLSDALFFSSMLVGEEGEALIGQIPASGAISQVFLGIAGTLATYVMLLVGLESAAAKTPLQVNNNSPVDDDYRGSVAWSEQSKVADTGSPQMASDGSRAVG